MAQFYTLEEAARVLGMNPEDLQAEAAAEAARLESRFSDEDLEKLIRAKGLAPEAPAADS